jgi:hypothetical protein
MMSNSHRRLIDWLALLVTTTLFLISVGCAKPAAKTHFVRGQFEVPGGDIELLAGHIVEVALIADPRVRAAGQIREDGTFALSALHEGAPLAGAKEGAYQARIVLSDDDPGRRNIAAKALPQRYLQFESSGLTLNVPSAEIVTLKVLRR